MFMLSVMLKYKRNTFSIKIFIVLNYMFWLMLNLVLKLNVTKYLFLYKRFTEKDKQLSNTIMWCNLIQKHDLYSNT